MTPISRDFVKAIHAFAKREGVEIVAFAKGQREDEDKRLVVPTLAHVVKAKQRVT